MRYTSDQLARARELARGYRTSAIVTAMNPGGFTVRDLVITIQRSPASERHTVRAYRDEGIYDCACEAGLHDRPCTHVGILLDALDPPCCPTCGQRLPDGTHVHATR